MLRTLGAISDKNVERLDVCRKLGEQLVSKLSAYDQELKASDWTKHELDRAALLCSLVTALLSIGGERTLDELVKHVVACRHYDLTDVQLAALFELETQRVIFDRSSPAVRKWLRACRGELERRTSQRPDKPADFRREAKLTCKCADCRVVAKFLEDPRAAEARFPMPEQRREHVRWEILQNKCDCTCDIIRQGRPYSLLCTKTIASYDEAVKIHARDLTHLSRVTKIESQVPAS